MNPTSAEIKSTRVAMGLTQEEFGSLAGGVGERMVRAWESGSNQPRGQRLVKVKELVERQQEKQS